MPIFIKDPATSEAVRKLAKLRRTTLTEAIRGAVLKDLAAVDRSEEDARLAELHRRVKQYADPVSLFQRFGVEDQLAAMYHPVVQLKSGGYLVINPTEALVSIDINSGRSTREHNIEQTATATPGRADPARYVRTNRGLLSLRDCERHRTDVAVRST